MMWAPELDRRAEGERLRIEGFILACRESYESGKRVIRLVVGVPYGDEVLKYPVYLYGWKPDRPKVGGYTTVTGPVCRGYWVDADGELCRNVYISVEKF